MIRILSILAIFILYLPLVNGSLDYTDFNLMLNDSERVLKIAKEGNLNGEFESGSRNLFRQTIDRINASSVFCITSLQLDSVTDILHNEYLTFLKKRYGILRPLVSDNYTEFASTTSKWGSHNLHDPAIIQSKGYFYVYGTDAAWGQSVKGIPYRRSRDLVNWEYLGTVFNGTYPIENNKWIDSLTNEPGHTQTGIWAPYIMKVGEEYRLYYSSIHAPNGATISLAVSNHPRGPWKQRGALVYYKDNGNIATNAIDPTITIGKDGRFWMAWGSWSQGIYMVEIDPTTGLKKNGASQFVIARNRAGWIVKDEPFWTHSTLEGPEIIYNPTFKKYYLFLAEGDLGTIYQTRVARADNPNGPYKDINDFNVVYSINKDIYPLLSYAYQFGNHPGWQGVAHCGVINVNGEYFMLNQGRPTSVSSMMDLHVKKIYWTESGWPVISPERYSNPGLMPVITSDLIAGIWEEILLNEIKNGGVSEDLPSTAIKDNPSQFLCKPTTLKFSSAGTISPSGSWSYDGKYMTIIKGGYTYKVSVAWEWDWENGCETLIYTGLRSDGRSLWGKKSSYLERENKNLVTNSSFENELRGYNKISTSGNVVTSFTDSTSGSLNFINGKTFNALINTQATNYWDQALTWRFPAQKAARYKVSFKYKTTASTPIHVELQETAKDFTALYRQDLTLNSSGTIQFITNDVSVTDPFYTLNLQYGKATNGVKILFDDITIQDITGQWDGNYVSNGDFECGLDSWTRSIFSSVVSGSISDTFVIKGNNSLRLTNTQASLLNKSTNCYYWKAYLHGGWKYRVEFDVRGSGSVNAFLKLSSSFTSTSVNEIAGFNSSIFTGQVQTFGFDIPEIPSNNEYGLGFAPQANSDFIVDNIKLYIQESPVGLKPVQVNDFENIRIYPNPTNGIINFSSSLLGGHIEIFDLQGRKRISEQIYGIQMNLKELGKGIYIVKINSNGQLKTEKLLVY